MPVKLCKKIKVKICTFVQVCAKRFRLCPTYKATSDKGSLLASYYFSKIAQRKKKILKEKDLSRKWEFFPGKLFQMQAAKKTHKRKVKALTKISRQVYLDSRISAALPFFSLQQFICTRPRKRNPRIFRENVDKNRNFRNCKRTWELPES